MKLLLSLILLALSSLAAAQVVPVLIYHRVTTDQAPSGTVISPLMFKRHLDRIQELGMTTITVRQLEEHLREGAPLPRSPVLLTFDDGWKDNLGAAEELSRRGMTATFYVLSGTFDSPLYLSKEELRQVAARHEVGAHSHTHFMEWISDLSKIDDRVMMGEIVMSKAIIEKVIGRQVSSLAWPFGYFREHLLVQLPQLGFSSTLHVNSESRNMGGTDPLRIQRLNIDGTCSENDLEQMLKTGKLKECK